MCTYHSPRQGQCQRTLNMSSPLEGVKEMVCMALTNKLEAKVVNNENKGDGALLVSPKSWCHVGLEITEGMESFSE